MKLTLKYAFLILCLQLPAAGAAKVDEGLRQAFERASYSLDQSGRGIWRGENRAQQLTVEFDGQEARLSHPDGALSFRLTGYGYGDRLQQPAQATLTGSGSRLEYRRGDLTEWYVNEPAGLEQGFTLARRPTGSRGGPLEITIEAGGELQPFENPGDDAIQFQSGGETVLRYGGLKAVDARGRILGSRMEVRGREIRLIVEDGDAEYPVVVDPTTWQQQKLTAADGALGDSFGYSVGLSGDTAVIGAYGKNARQGAVYVFVRSGNLWGLQQKLTASDGVAGDWFGVSVAVDADTAVIGAYYKNSAIGAAYVFVRSGSVWSQQQKLAATDGAVGDEFGVSVAVSADTAVIGAVFKNSATGAAYVFVRSAGSWTQQQELLASDGNVNDSFGKSVAVNADTVVVGAQVKNAYQGAAYVFVRSGSSWSQQQKLTASDGAAGDSFGISVSVNIDTALVGAYLKNSFQGAAYVFVRSSGAWTQQQKLTSSDGAPGDYFGYSVSVSENMAAIGAYAKQNLLGGAAYVFSRSGTVWTEVQELTALDGVQGDAFGNSVSVSGDTVLVGAYQKLSVVGAAYVFVSRPLQFVPITPCRIMDTRAGSGFSGAFGQPSLAANVQRDVPIPTSNCGVPTNAVVYSLNLTVIPQQGFSDLVAWPAGQSAPGTSNLHSSDGSVLADAALVSAGTNGAISVQATGNTDLVIDVNGYFAAPGASSLQFFPVTPCRVIDTRNTAGTFGGPKLVANTARDFPILSGPCAVSASATAYSVNVTVVPTGVLWYVTAGPAGQPVPFVSTLNDYAGAGVPLANAAIVPAGTGGAVTFLGSQETDLIVDINGYFGPPAAGGLNFYPVPPCRAADTRGATSPLGGPIIPGYAVPARSFPLPQSACALPPSAGAYSLNISAIPNSGLWYLTAWPTGQPAPFVSTLNDYKGLPAANQALVPAGTGGSINVLVSQDSHVTLDVNGYFAQ